MRRNLAMMSLLTCSLACSSGEFSASNSEAPAAAEPTGSDSAPKTSNASDQVVRPERQVPSEVSVPAASPSIPVECPPAGVTQATLLTPKALNGQPGNYLEYEISLTDCTGQRRQLTANSIFFDTDTISNGAGSGNPLRYTLTADGVAVTGVLVEISGSDLFGKTGPGYYYNRTDQAVSVQTTTTSVRLRIELMGQTFQSYGAPPSAPQTPLVVATFLRFGEATPVRKDVVFE